MLGFAPSSVLAAPREYKLLRAFESRNTCTYCAVSCGMLLYSTGKPYDALSSHTGTNTRSKLFHLEGDPDHPVKPVGHYVLKVLARWTMLIVKAVHYTLNIEHRVLTNGFVFLGKKRSNAFLVY